MIDNITMVKKSLSEDEKTNIINSSRLVSNSLNGLTYYDNRSTKNFTGGLFIQIDTRNKLKISGSIHKYHSHLESGRLTNFETFTMDQAKGTFKKLIVNTGVNPNNIEVTFFEVGINLKFDFDVKPILDKVHSIGKTEKPFFIEPKFKDGRQITTGTHRDFRVHFKMYDKIFEMKDSRKPVANFKHHILRIETVHRRVEKLQLNQLIDNDYLQAIQNDFFTQWNGLNFYNDIEAPKGTQRSKIDLVRNIIYCGKNVVLNDYKSQYENKALTKRQFYAVRDFLNSWELIRSDFTIKKSAIVPFWDLSYSIEKQLLIS